MKARSVLLAALAVTATLVSVASAGSAATKQRVALELRFSPSQTFLFIPQESGTLKGDSGRITKIPETSGRTVIRDGQRIVIYNATWPLKGKRGTLSIRERNEWILVGGDANKDRQEDSVAFGTWKVVGGTGQYAGATGGGRSGHAGLGDVWNARYEGFFTTG